MANLALIGIDKQELHWLRALIVLLRHPDPGVPELARQAIQYLTEAAAGRTSPRPTSRDYAG